jgi:hypothetical protein
MIMVIKNIFLDFELNKEVIKMNFIAQKPNQESYMYSRAEKYF